VPTCRASTAEGYKEEFRTAGEPHKGLLCVHVMDGRPRHDNRHRIEHVQMLTAEQILAPITLIRGGSSRGFYFEGNQVPLPGNGLEEFLLAVRGSPDPMGMDGLGGDTILQSKAAIVSPSARSDADVDYTFIQIFPDQPATLTYKMNCGNISAGVPVFALMKNMLPHVKNDRPPETKAWVEADDLTAASFFLRGDDINVQKNR